ncbi:hypothetical protein [Pacificoceanicola onchidii]|uniref:hypothetical protein n=1 Tax=Pacificoceanicola onchidii TaxID=2562685 RepID=UPI0010A5CD89|nr:hypothetical protein [Pacificoceanicola onchidii]
MRMPLILSATIATLGMSLPVAALADDTSAESEQGQRDILIACNDRLFGVPHGGQEIVMETTWRNNMPMVRVIEGGARSEHEAFEVNACAARHLGLGAVTRGAGGMGYGGCYPGAPKMIRGTTYCFN